MHALIRLVLCFSACAILKFGDSDRYLKVVKRLGSGTRRRGIMFYGTIVWDPWLILAQIVCLQCLYYLTLGFFMVLLVGTRVSRMSLMYFFDFSMLVASTVTGWCAIVSFMLSSLAGCSKVTLDLPLLFSLSRAVFLLYLIERAKKCLDFSATLYIIHLFISIIYGGWPSSITWWVVNIIGLALMSLLGEWLCIRREMQEIPITRLRSSKHYFA
ncbi:hypothetical protein ZIOFF_052967 [Zingiber officinale]|uniref:Protein SYS1 homolog n=1 Tax=Zingiber officinale TaxID=94328 RepID=A0A8J5FBS8_ZINOF|nr:hypothetical protein ZIOFF_052967 [Zingiber officinale]